MTIRSSKLPNPNELGNLTEDFLRTRPSSEEFKNYQKKKNYVITNCLMEHIKYQLRGWMIDQVGLKAYRR